MRRYSEIGCEARHVFPLVPQQSVQEKGKKRTDSKQWSCKTRTGGKGRERGRIPNLPPKPPGRQRKRKRNERGRGSGRKMARERVVFPARGAARCRTPEGDAPVRLPSIAIDCRRKRRGPAVRRREGKGTAPRICLSYSDRSEWVPVSARVRTRMSSRMK